MQWCWGTVPQIGSAPVELPNKRLNYSKTYLLWCYPPTNLWLLLPLHCLDCLPFDIAYIAQTVITAVAKQVTMVKTADGLGHLKAKENSQSIGLKWEIQILKAGSVKLYLFSQNGAAADWFVRMDRNTLLKWSIDGNNTKHLKLTYVRYELHDTDITSVLGEWNQLHVLPPTVSHALATFCDWWIFLLTWSCRKQWGGKPLR